MSTLKIQDRLEQINNSFTSVLEINGIIIDSKFKARVHGESIELSLFNGDRYIFGGTIQLYFLSSYGLAPKLQISCGSTGSFDLSDESEVAKCLAMAELVKNFKMLSTLVECATSLYTQAVEENNAK